MMLPDARALAKRLIVAHPSSDFYGVLRNNRGHSMIVMTNVAPETIIRWFAKEGMIVTKVDKQLDKADTWRVWFQEDGSGERA